MRIMNWEAYDKKLKKKAVKSDFSFTFDGVLSDDIMPPLTKASAWLLKDAIAGGLKRIIMVLPENQELSCTLFLEKFLNDIDDGTIASDYDLSKFEIGENVSIGKAVIKYLGTYYNKEKKQVFIKLGMIDKTGPMTVYAPLSMVPVLQHANPNKALSKAAVYEEEKEKVAPDVAEHTAGPLGKIALTKTHLAGTTLFISSSKRVRDLIVKSYVNELPLSDLVNMAQVDLEGTITPVGSAELSGVPGLVVASDLYSASLVADDGMPIESITIVVEKTSAINKELEFLDELLALNIPITVLLDSANSMDLVELTKRNFFQWRWNQNWLTTNMRGSYDSIYSEGIDNIQNRYISYEVISEEMVSEAFSLIHRNKDFAESQTSSINTLFEKLLELAFQTVRAVVPVDEVQKELIRSDLDQLEEALNQVKTDMPVSKYKDFKKAITNFKTIYKSDTVLPKISKLEELLANAKTTSIVLTFPSSFDIEGIQTYWRSWMKQQSIDATLEVYTFADYYLLAPIGNAQTIISCWFNSERMKRLLFANKTPSYSVILYGFESIWLGNHQAKWDWEINKSDNAEICLQYLHLEVESEEDEVPAFETIPDDNSEEFDELEKFVSTIKYKKYIQGDNSHGHERVTVIPVFFSNGTFMFMRLGQEVVSVTKMLLQDWNDIEKKDSLDLSVGEYIVFRDSGKDLIREVADSLLQKSGQIDARKTASKWRQALELEMMFSSDDEIYQKMKRLGWAKTKDTFQRWIMDETLIAPKTKKDIEILAKATDNSVTEEMIDSIYQASQIVRNAHISAGRLLSSRLKNELGHHIKEMAINTDGHWDSVDIQIEDVGNARIMKITDIGQQVRVDFSNVGRLMQD